MSTNSNRPFNEASTSAHPKHRRFLIPRSERQSFLSQFTLMTILGWVVGGIASLGIEKIIVEVLPSTVLQQPIWYALGKYTSSSVFALIFGADQALVLRQYISGWLWMFATALGWLISDGVSTAWIHYISSTASSLNRPLSFEETFFFGILSTTAYILSGIWLGFLQWLILRRYTSDVWWWNFVPSISFLFISIFVWLLSLLQGFIPAVNRDVVAYLIGQGLTAVILGFVPATGLCILKTNFREKNVGE